MYDGFMPSSDPIPYHAQLAKTLHGPTLALVLTYLEIHHPAPQDPESDPHGLGNAPVVIDADAVCADLGISRRTLHVALNCLGACWSDEVARARAARSGREFLNESHSGTIHGHDKIKIYSITGLKAYSQPRTLTIRRNPSKLSSITQINDINIPCKPFEVTGAPVFTVPTLVSVLPKWGDRRADRWERWRRENGRKSRNPGRMRGAKDRREMLEQADNVYMDENVAVGC